jgi:hypothetical protein
LSETTLNLSIPGGTDPEVVQASLPEGNTFMCGLGAAIGRYSDPSIIGYTMEHWDVSSRTRRNLQLGDKIIFAIKSGNAFQITMKAMVQYWIIM